MPAAPSGQADPEALPLASATQQAVEFIGLPEARIPLAHATAYMCRAKKSREAYEALGAATEEIESERTEQVHEERKSRRSSASFPILLSAAFRIYCVFAQITVCKVRGQHVRFPLLSTGYYINS
jgi:hypothetical protein